MFMRGVFLNILLGHLLRAGAGATCVPVQCLRCNATGESQADPCLLCSNNTECSDDIPPNYKKDFQVSVNSTGSNVKEGDDITLTCLHNFPDLNLTFGWKRDGEDIHNGKNKSKLHLKNVFARKRGRYICFVNSLCGCYKSSPHKVTVEDQSVLLLIICCGSALVLVVIMGLAMKFKLKRDGAKHRERREQKAKEQNSAPATLTPRES
ncbi:uncharacterized protein LOC116389464 [Anarrhichthys ocellatus]|uniref:uncharacterized protein LOC116389464 n=1 Tax=Anarrhichthys ocellatus TaxID=433405 RepID=UPI0012ED3C0C|nr:uncharacterized protein LOC116389464 [Anarrhichthys ocellatus]